MRVNPFILLAMMATLWALPARGVAATDDVQALMRNFGVELPHERKPAPDFLLKELGGGEANLAEQRGKLVLLHFWATWCPPCRKEMPLLQSLDKRLTSRGLKVVCVNVNRGNRHAVREFMHEVSPGFHTLLDANGVVRNRYEVRALPTSYLIAGDGRIIGRIIGERAWNNEASMHLFGRLVDEYIKEDREK